MGGKFYVSIHVSFANSCVSKGYANGEWFGFGDIRATTLTITRWYSTTYIWFWKPGFEAGTPKEAGLFRSLNSPFELNAGVFLPRGSAKFSVWRIPGTRGFWGEKRKIPVSPFSKRRKIPPIHPPNRTAPCPHFGFEFVVFQDKRHQTMSKSAYYWYNTLQDRSVHDMYFFQKLDFLLRNMNFLTWNQQFWGLY